jgi:hypothetical protein
MLNLFYGNRDPKKKFVYQKVATSKKSFLQKWQSQNRKKINDTPALKVDSETTFVRTTQSIHLWFKTYCKQLKVYIGGLVFWSRVEHKSIILRSV